MGAAVSSEDRLHEEQKTESPEQHMSWWQELQEMGAFSNTGSSLLPYSPGLISLKDSWLLMIGRCPLWCGGLLA